MFFLHNAVCASAEKSCLFFVGDIITVCCDPFVLLPTLQRRKRLN